MSPFRRLQSEDSNQCSFLSNRIMKNPGSLSTHDTRGLLQRHCPPRSQVPILSSLHSTLILDIGPVQQSRIFIVETWPHQRVSSSSIRLGRIWDMTRRTRLIKAQMERPHCQMSNDDHHRHCRRHQRHQRLRALRFKLRLLHPSYRHWLQGHACHHRRHPHCPCPCRLREMIISRPSSTS